MHQLFYVSLILSIVSLIISIYNICCNTGHRRLIREIHHAVVMPPGYANYANKYHSSYNM